MTASSPGAGARGRANRWNLLLGLLIGAVVIIVLIWLLASGGLRVVRALIGSVDPVAKWFALMAVMAGLLVYIGRRTNGRWLGVLIDSTNTMSLSRLQVTLWTIMVLSAYLMLAWPRIFGAMAALPDLSEDDPLLAACRERLGDTVPSMDLCGGGALQIEFPPELVLAMGISLASFAGSHLIKNVKSTHELDLAHRDTKVNEARQKFAQADSARDQAADDAKQPTMDLVLARTAHDQADAAVQNPPAGANPDDLRLALAKAKMELDAALKSSQAATQALEQAEAGAAAAEKALETAQKEEQAARTQAEGVLHKNDSPDKASFHDIFRGNQITNYLQVDLGKVQMFFFTLVVLLAYGAAVAALLRNNLALLHPLGIGFPPFSDSLNALLALSHGTYLTVKAAAQS